MMSGKPERKRRWILAVVMGLVVFLAFPVQSVLGNGGGLYLPLVFRQIPPPTPTPEPGWFAEYYANEYLGGTPVVQQYENVPYPDKEWGDGSPFDGMPADRFSARFTKSVWFEPGDYQFILTVDDGGRMYLDGEAVIDEWHRSTRGLASYVYETTFETAGLHQVKVEYYEDGGAARMRAFWINKSQFPEWRAEYFNNESLSGPAVLVRNEKDASHDWGYSSPAPGVVGYDHFSVRFTRAIYLGGAGSYVFRAVPDDGVLVWVDAWTPGQPTTIDAWEGKVGQVTSNVEILQPGWYVITVAYREAIGYASLTYQQIFGGTTYGLRAEYYPVDDLSGSPTFFGDEEWTKVEPTHKEYSKDWGEGAARVGLPIDHFSARWRHTFETDGGKYRFYAKADDGVRIYVDDVLILDRWVGYVGQEHSVEYDLSGKFHVIQVDYHELYGSANITFGWEKK